MRASFVPRTESVSRSAKTKMLIQELPARMAANEPLAICSIRTIYIYAAVITHGSNHSTAGYTGSLAVFGG